MTVVQESTRLTARVVLMLLMGICFVLPAPIAAQEGDDPEAEVVDEWEVEVGGALRFNYRYMDWNDETYADVNNSQGGEFLLDTYRINAGAMYKNVALSLEYRFYAGYNMLHHGYVGYRFSPQWNMLVGVHQVPFNITPYASHNWFFSLAYYLGLEDDYDAGVQLIHESERGLNFQLAYYKNSEGNYTGESEASSRYSYDIVPEGSGFISYLGAVSNNREVHQFNGRVTYTLDHGDLGGTELGAWGQYGFLWNDALDVVDGLGLPNAEFVGETDQWGDHFAVGGHVNGTYGGFNLMLYGMYVEHNPKVLDEADFVGENEPEDFNVAADFGDSVVVFGAYDFPYLVASKGILFGIGPAYTVPVNWGPISSLQFYNDFSAYIKDDERFTGEVEDTYHNVTGVLVTAGGVYTYIDVAQGYNHPWLGNFTNGLAQGNPDAEWKMRFNVNIGYYF